MKADPADIMSAANPESASLSSDQVVRLGAPPREGWRQPGNRLLAIMDRIGYQSAGMQLRTVAHQLLLPMKPSSDSKHREG